jgi:hypothetical protein
MAHDPPYLESIRALTKKPRLSEIDCERVILSSWKAEYSQDPSTVPPGIQWSETIEFDPALEPFHASGWTLHFHRYLRLLIPNVVSTPELLRMIHAIEQTRIVEGRKIINFIGHKNSGKTNLLAAISIALTSITPEFSRCYISGPYKGSADAIVWGRLGTRWNQMLSANRHAPWLLECLTMKSEDRYTIYPGSTEAGYIELITLDKIGKLQGVKSLDADKGWLIIICDEVNQFPTRAFLDVLENAKGNRNLLVITACNFRNIEGMEGDLCRPEGREYSDLKIDSDFDWLSAFSSHTWRFDGHRCSNILAGRTIYSFLLDEPTRAESERDNGKDGPKYLEQIRSHPNSSMSDFFVLTRERVRAGGGYDDVTWEGVQPRRVVFLDPGFGGDPCRIGLFRFGQARVPSTDGTFITSNIFEPEVPFETVILSTTQKCDEDWMRRLVHVARGQMLMRTGSDVTMENQIAVQAAEFCLKHDVPYGDFGFDGSMRAAIVQEICAVMGTVVHAIDPVGSATDRPLPFQQDRVANAEFFNFVSEEYFNFAALVQARQFRGGDRVPAAISQICRRPWKWTGDRKQIQPKDQYKKENQGRSPDDADVLVGGFEMALRKGFITTHSRRPEAAAWALDTTTLMRELGKSERFRPFGTKKLGAA